jgi:hypothetical protein
MMIRKILFVVAFVFIAAVSYAEDKKMTPEEQQMYQQQIQLMTPLYGYMAKAMIEAQLEVLANPATAEKLATFTKNYYDALIKKGFSRDEALKIAMTAGFPAFPSMTR